MIVPGKKTRKKKKKKTQPNKKQNKPKQKNLQPTHQKAPRHCMREKQTSKQKTKYPTLLQWIRNLKQFCARSQVIQTFFFHDSVYKLILLIVNRLFQPLFVRKQQDSLPHLPLWLCLTLEISPSCLLGSSIFSELVSFNICRLAPSHSWQQSKLSKRGLLLPQRAGLISAA